jgi:predicted N-acyltransferase
MLRISLHNQINEIEPDRWDAAGSDPFSTHAMLSALEGAGMEGISLRYAVIMDATGSTVACAPLARVQIDAGRLTHGLFRRLIDAMRRVQPGFMHTSAFICGTPLSVGNPPVRIINGVDPTPIFKEAAGLLTELADEEKVPWRAFKEFPRGQLMAAHCLAQEGWILASSEPNFVLPIRWPGFREYLGSLRSHYRYKIRKSERKLKERGIRVQVLPLEEAYQSSLHGLYEDVVGRASVVLERLTPAFFTALGQSCGDRARLIRFSRNGRAVGWVALLIDGDRVYDLFHGIDYGENSSADLYFNQLAQTVRYAIECRARQLSLGQSTETAKTRFGGEPIPLWIAVRHRLKVVNAVLHRGAPLLFPDRSATQRHLFSGEATP